MPMNYTFVFGKLIGQQYIFFTYTARVFMDNINERDNND